MKDTALFKKFLGFFSLDGEVDSFDRIHQNIVRDISFRGTNLWILIFAIFIASIGLNMNSAAVIIGAMLISPLMGPINGMGFSLATFDFPLLRRSLKNFGFAVFASLATSTIYFSLTPITTAYSELLARTSPTIYDVLIALFGGMAGIVASSTRQKGNAIPGVAIATALMPPLCTAGYGLANGNLTYFLGALYLFAINTVFIALASVAMSQILKFPIRNTIEEVQKKRINRGVTVVTILVLIPSIYFGYMLVNEERFTGKANKFVQEIGIVDVSYLLKSETLPDKRNIILTFGGPRLDDQQKKKIIEKARSHALSEATIIFKQGLSFDVVTARSTQEDILKAELNKMKVLLQEKEAQVDSLRQDRLKGRQMLDEIRNLYPEIVNCSYAETYVFQDSSSTPLDMGIIVFSTRERKLKSPDMKKINNWVRSRLNTDEVKVIFEQL